MSTITWPLPAVDVRPVDLCLEWGLPTEATLGQMLTMTLRLTNRSSSLRSLRLSFSENDSFLFCGLKLHHFRLPPSFSHALTFNLVPIKTGALKLPMPKLLCVPTGRAPASPPKRVISSVTLSQESVFTRVTQTMPELLCVPTGAMRCKPSQAPLPATCQPSETRHLVPSVI